MAATALPDPTAIRPVEVVRTNDYSEGPVVDRQGNIYFSHGSLITRVAPDGTVEDWARSKAPNGHKIRPTGDHLVCDGQRHAVLHLDAGGREIGIAASGHVGELTILTPNDLTLDPEGGFYFSDSVPETGAVFFVDADGQKRLVAGNIDFANGVTLTADRRRLYVAESLQNRILVIELQEPGVPAGPPELFAELPRNEARPGPEWNQPDGMALDLDGRLWVAHYGMQAVHVLEPDGRRVRTYDGGNVTTSNVCFAGPRLDQLYVTGGEPGALFRLDVGVPGLPLLS
jgi:gluconolactonase